MKIITKKKSTTFRDLKIGDAFMAIEGNYASKCCMKTNIGTKTKNGKDYHINTICLEDGELVISYNEEVVNLVDAEVNIK